jgi:hypothetical protein
MPRVLNCRRDLIPSDAVYVDRSGPFGNPFKLTGEASRGDVIARHRKWVCGQPALVERIKRELAGRDLVCWCAPKPCHGDTLFEIANGYAPSRDFEEKTIPAQRDLFSL